MAFQQKPDRRVDIRLGYRPQCFGGGSGDLGRAGAAVRGNLPQRCPQRPHRGIVRAMTFDPLLQELREAPQPVLRLRTGPGPDPPVVALLSGSFDPLTVGHAELAQAALGHADLVLLVYSVSTLPKEGEPPEPLLSEDERLAVLEAFCEARPGIEPALCSHGLIAEQVEAAVARFPASDLVLVMGSDKVRQLLDPKWYENRELALEPLFSRATVLYAERTGEQGMVERLLGRPENVSWRHRFHRLEVAPDAASISSRMVRQQLASGNDVGQLVPAESMALLVGKKSPRS